MKNMPEKIYYLSSVRATLIGLILMLMGFGLSFIGFDVNQSFWQNFQSMVVDFRGVANLFAPLLMLFLKLMFIIFGYFTLKSRNGIIRAKIDNKGFYFKEITGKSKMEKTAFDLNPLTFLPYSQLLNIYLLENKWTGIHLEIETKLEKKRLVTLDALTHSQKKEIYQIIRQKIKYLSSVGLILMGFGVSFIGFDVNPSFWQNFQGILVDFSV